MEVFPVPGGPLMRWNLPPFTAPSRAFSWSSLWLRARRVRSLSGIFFGAKVGAEAEGSRISSARDEFLSEKTALCSLTRVVRVVILLMNQSPPWPLVSSSSPRSTMAIPPAHSSLLTWSSLASFASVPR